MSLFVIPRENYWRPYPRSFPYHRLFLTGNNCSAKSNHLPARAWKLYSETSILAIKNQCLHHPVVGHLIRNIISSATALQYFSFAHTCRQGNGLAHALARKARLSFPVSIWKESVPLGILKRFVSDLLAIK